MTGFLSAVSFLPVYKLQTREEEEEEEETKGRGQGRAVTSDPELSSDAVVTEVSGELQLVNNLGFH